MVLQFQKKFIFTKTNLWSFHLLSLSNLKIFAVLCIVENSQWIIEHHSELNIANHGNIPIDPEPTNIRSPVFCSTFFSLNISFSWYLIFMDWRGLIQALLSFFRLTFMAPWHPSSRKCPGLPVSLDDEFGSRNLDAQPPSSLAYWQLVFEDHFHQFLPLLHQNRATLRHIIAYLHLLGIFPLIQLLK